MIAYLSGTVQRRLPDGVILKVGGVGYHVHMPLGAVMNLPAPDEELEVWIYTKVREDAIQLFGFTSFSERQIFTLLIDINGVGPKVALAILSTMTGEQLREVVEKQQPELLQMVPGIGKRMADKVVLELSSRVARFPASEGRSSAQGGARQPLLHEHLAAKGKKASTLPLDLQQDLRSALENLGYREKDIAPLVQKFSSDYQGEDLGQLLRQALVLITQNKHHRQSETSSDSILF